MNKYQVFVDIPLDEEWNEIDVLYYIIEANDPEQARELCAVEVENDGYDDYYVWEVSKEDIIED